MSSGSDVTSTASGVQLVRELLLGALHFGRCEPGDRAPSVRKLAMVTGMNRKTIHRAYQRLAAEGMLAVRRGSGTFFAERTPDASARPATATLLEAVDRCRREARRLGLDDAVFGKFVLLALNGRMARLRVAVCECNLEQVGLIGREVAETLGSAPREVVLADLQARPVAALGACRLVVTTDCHRDEVLAATTGLGVSVHRIALEREFTDTLVRRARRRRVVMVVADRRYGPIFQRMLRQLGVHEDIVGRFAVVEPAEYASAVLEIDDAFLYVSPLVEHELPPRATRGAQRIRPGRYLSARSLETLRAAIALEIAAAT